MSLVGERAGAPRQVGAVLVLRVGPSLNPVAIRAALEQRLPSVPRLRHRLTRVPFGAGRPVWVDDADFDLDNHFVVGAAGGPLSHQGLLDLAADLVTGRLPPDRPLWRATLVGNLGVDHAALVVVLHHVLADGEAGLALLGDLVATEPAPADATFPRPAPARLELSVDAIVSRLDDLRRLPGALVRLAAATVVLGPALGRTAPACSLTQPTGLDRRLRTVGTDLTALAALAHRSGVTINDVFLTLVAGALHDLLAGRGEDVSSIVASVPFSDRTHQHGRELGNRSGVVTVRLLTRGTFATRLASTAASTQEQKRHLRGASTAILAPVFRILDRVGLYQRFVNHQTLVNTFVSNVRGPGQQLSLAGLPIVDLIPLSVTSGNVTVAFTALSYGGHFVITINADPVTCPDLDRLDHALRSQLRASGLPAAADATALAGRQPREDRSPSRH